MWGDQGYQGQGEAIRQHAARAQDFTNRVYRRHGKINEIEKAKNLTNAIAIAVHEHRQIH